jgi:hypothetical protein
MSDPEWIALESLEELTRHFIFGATVLTALRDKGLVEPRLQHWRVTNRGLQALRFRDVDDGHHQNADRAF